MDAIVEQTCRFGRRDNVPMTKPLRWIALLVGVCGVACSPTLDWREFVPEGSGVSVTFPCRPDRHARTVRVATTRMQMDMLVCSAGDATFAVSYVDVADPSRVSATLVDLRAAALGNVQGVAPHLVEFQIKGATPNEEAKRLTVSGRLPDGAAVQEHVAFFTRGLRVYQATVIGARPSPQAVETFLGGLKFPE
jgi:hypothetical protein